MKVTRWSAGITVAVLLLTVGCASTNVQSTTAQPQQSPTTTAATAASEAKSGLERFVGDYNFGQFTAAIRLRGGTLIRQVSGSEQVLRPISGTRFKIGSTPAELEFMLDKSGQVTGVIEGAEGHTRRGTRVPKA